MKWILLFSISYAFTNNKNDHGVIGKFTVRSFSYLRWRGIGLEMEIVKCVLLNKEICIKVVIGCDK